MRPIDADAVLESIQDWYQKQPYDEKLGAMYVMVLSTIKDAPTVDDRISGAEWVYNGKERFCSECGASYPPFDYAGKMNWCPSCGKKIWGERFYNYGEC